MLNRKQLNEASKDPEFDAAYAACMDSMLADWNDPRFGPRPKPQIGVNPISGARPTKARRTKNDIAALKNEIVKIVNEIRPATVRQTYYQAVSRGVIAKTEQAYKTLGRLLAMLRREGRVPFGSITDSTRYMRKPKSFTGLDALLADTAALYRRSVWADQNAYVEIWLEKDALSGVLWPITSKYDVPLMCTRGYPSLTFLHSAAEAIREEGKPTYLYYFGDHDPSGVDIPKKVEAGIREFAPDVDLHFQRVAVTTEQIHKYRLPTRPTKKTDSRSRSFEGESVEVDAIPPAELRAITEQLIEQHLDQRKLSLLKVAERSERDWLRNLASTWRDQ